MVKSKQNELIELLSGMIQHIEKTTTKKEGFFDKVSNSVLVIIIAGMCSVIGFNFNEVTKKADKETVERDYVQKLTYYQIEADEHRIMKPLFLTLNQNGDKITNVIEEINDHMAGMLGFKYGTTRGGGEKK